MNRLMFITLSMLVVSSASAQVESNSTQMRPWYSIYANKKLNHRWSIDAFGLLAMRSMDQDFWLTQVTLGANYRLNRFWTLSFGYGHSRYQHTGAWWNKHYPSLKPGIFNTVAFQSLNIGLRRTDLIGRNFQITNSFGIQKYFPKLEKYGTRMQLTSKLSYRRRNLPMGIRPFVTGSLYYYLDGVPATYYDEELEPFEELSPDGLHRYRARFGINFRPISNKKRISMTLYYGINREFNGIGNDLNFPRPSSSDTRTLRTYPFNNYDILGVQINCFLR